jgi:ubiquinone/menaquinone biosynthesis C-methylase UbiE
MTRREDTERGEDDTEWDATRYDDQCGFVSAYGAGATDLLDVGPGDRLLDLGCGTGTLSRRFADAGVDVVGVDALSEMVGRARDRHGDVDGLRFVHGDARDLSDVLDSDDSGTFDAVFSNAALHWIPGPDHDAVLEEVARLLRPRGAFVAELGGCGNVASVVAAVAAELDTRDYPSENPWYFPSVGEYAPRLEAHGLEVRQAALFDRPTKLDGGADGLREWLAMFGDGLLASVPETETGSVIDAVVDRLRGERFDGEAWTVDYRRLRFRAVNVG